MDLQAHYQTFFTGVVVIGAVLLDMYRTKKASEVRVLTPAQQFRADELAAIGELKTRRRERAAAGKSAEAATLEKEISRRNAEMKVRFKEMRDEERAAAARTKAESKETLRRSHHST
jgi:ribose transport system permease protein